MCSLNKTKLLMIIVTTGSGIVQSFLMGTVSPFLPFPLGIFDISTDILVVMSESGLLVTSSM